MNCPAGTPNGVEALPEQALEAATHAMLDRQFVGKPERDDYTWRTFEGHSEAAVRGFLAALSTSDLRALLKEREDAERDC